MEGVAVEQSSTTLTALRRPSTALVSVVIPTYNRAPRLRRLLDAVAAADVPAGGLEVVVVDDGSSDATSEVAADAGVRYIRQSNAGPAAAREVGWRSARGEVIVFLDDDVVPEPDAVVRMVAALDEADGVGAEIHPLDADPLIAHYMHVDGLVDHKVTTDGRVLWLITAAAAFRRSALESVGGFDLGFPRAAGEDVDLSLRLAEQGFTLRIEPGVRVRHDHRSSFKQLMRTCHRYGSAYKLLASRHSVHRADRKRSALLRLSPLEWVRVFLGYRLQATVRRSLAFVGLHAIVAVPYAFGILRRTPVTPPQIAAVELVGRAQSSTGSSEPGRQFRTAESSVPAA